MATGIEARIADILIGSVASKVTFSPAIPVAYPGRDFAPSEKYLEVTHLTNRPAQVALGSSGENRHIGIFQINVVVQINDAGVIPSSEIASAVASAYKRGTELTETGSPLPTPALVVRVYEPPHVGSAFPREGSLITPVSIRWQCDAPNS